MANQLKSKTATKIATPKASSDFNESMKAESNPNLKVKEVVKDDRTAKIIGFLSLAICIFLFVSFSSYLFSWQDDQDLIQNYGVKIFKVDDVHVRNMFGVLGAYVSNGIMNNGFGIVSFILCTFFFVLGINQISETKVFRLARNVKYVLVGILVISVAASFFAGNNAEFSYGGAVGNLINSWLIKWLGRFGTGCILTVMVICYLVWRFNPSFNLDSIKTKAANLKKMAVSEEDSDEDVALDEEEIVTPPPAPKRTVGPMTAPFVTTNEADALGEVRLTPAEKAAEIQPMPVIKPTISEETKEEPTITLEVNAEVAKPVVPKKITIIPPAQNPILPTYDEHEEMEIPTMPQSSNSDLQLEIEEEPENENTFETEIEQKSNARPPMDDYDPTLGLSRYEHPNVNMLEMYDSEKQVHDQDELENNKNQIVNTLKNYDIAIQRISATVGPTVTLYEIVPAPGVRISKIKNLEDDIALSLAALGIRIIAPIPGRGTIGIEVPNINKSIVSMHSIINSDKFQNTKYSLPIALGKKINNENFIVDLASMPHLLMAGATGQGKSVGINAILVSLLYKKHPSQLKLVMVDPKKVELSLYRVIENHFLAKLPGEEEAIITDTKKVIATLNALCIEMDNRYDLLKEAGCRNIKEYNEKFIHRRLNPEKGHQYLPFIVLVIDEFADLIMTAGKEVEMPIARLAQLARAVGIHLIIATQRPSVNIITGTIKANFPARIAFKVSSKIDSRTILDAGGAEQLIGKGDMLISYNGDLTRLQCAFVDTPEVENICEFIGDQQGYPEAFLLPEYVDEKELESRDSSDLKDRDSMFEEAAKMVVSTQSGSTSMLQRRLKLGYNRAGRLMDQLEMAGVVGPNLGSKARDVLMQTEAELQVLLDNLP